MTIRAVLFDLDQTLWDSGRGWDIAETNALQSEALAPHFQRLGWASPGAEIFVTRFWEAFGNHHSDNPHLPDLSETQLPAILQQTLSEFELTCLDADSERILDAIDSLPFARYNIRPYDDCTHTLERLREAGLRMAIITNRPQPARTIIRELRAFSIPDVFACVVTSGEVGFRKPHASMFESALRRLNVQQPSEALIVGDSYEHDIVPAHALGLTTVLKLNRGERREECQLAHFQISDLDHLLDLEPFLPRGAGLPPGAG